MAHDFIELLTGGREFDRSPASLQQFDSKAPLQFLELTAVLALPVRIVSSRGSDSAGSDNLAKRFQPFQ